MFKKLARIMLISVTLLCDFWRHSDPTSSSVVSGAHPEKIVELGVFIDQYLYHHWLSLLPPTNKLSITSFMHSYLDVLVESLNLIYAHPSLRSSSFSGGGGREEEEGATSPLIGFHLTHTQLFWRGDASNVNPLTRETAPKYLETFCDFARDENTRGFRWDHALLLTGVDLKFPNGTNYGVAGISWDNSMCNRTYSCSIVEGRTFRSVMTAVHEIGHSLGIEHDGLKYNFKCAPRGYIMSHAGNNGDDKIEKIIWSACSRHNLRAFLTTAPNVLSNQVACLDNRPRSVKVSGRVMRGIGKGYRGVVDKQEKIPPGWQFSLEEQCQLAGGLKWRPSLRKSHIRKFCSMLHCNNTRTGMVVPFHPALEGTSCGHNLVCKYGECVPIQQIQG